MVYCENKAYMYRVKAPALFLIHDLIFKAVAEAAIAASAYKKGCASKEAVDCCSESSF